MKIIELQAENVKRLEAVFIRPEGSTVVIGGDNGAGKSSVLDSIAMALGGERLIPDEALRRGERKGSIELELSDGTKVLRTFSIGGGSRLRVTPAEGQEIRSPQTFLDKLLGDISFDPLRFFGMKAKEQRSTLAELIGLDTSDLDVRRQQVYDERTEVGREQRRYEGALSELPFHEDAPKELISVDGLVAELDDAEKLHTEAAKTLLLAGGVRRLAEEEQAKIERAIAHIEKLELEIERIRGEIRETQDRAAAHRMKALELDREHGELVPKLPNREAIKARIKSAGDENMKLRDNEQRAELSASVEWRRAKSDELTATLAGIDRAKAERIADAKYPIDGLSLDEEQVFFNGFPLEQASSAERLRVSVSIALAMHPQLKVLLIHDGSLLDAKSLELVAQMAEAADAQVWIERVSQGSECAVVIEDGKVRA